MKQTVLVTGGSGYVACQLVKQLLEAGDTVHATVRSLHDSPKLRPLRQLQADHPDQLRLFEADLLVPGSFAGAMQGCSVVHHVASPFRRKRSRTAAPNCWNPRCKASGTC
ncbi:NAD-dependent epimerase/dehydratase family protein [Xanthomonas axonopodis pv. phyllanthi]|uniref:NAD-dependent epimerase/dehydratase family protein n=1 Tax=Xanthomonas axonopodis TaxID=53413 RepID=UPI003557C51E